MSCVETESWGHFWSAQGALSCGKEYGTEEYATAMDDVTYAMEDVFEYVREKARD